jgi:hypothetical protein
MSLEGENFAARAATQQANAAGTPARCVDRSWPMRSKENGSCHAVNRVQDFSAKNQRRCDTASAGKSQGKDRNGETG